MAIRVGRGIAEIELDDALSDAVERTIARAAPSLLPAMRREAEAIRANAEAEAPVKTGRFRDGFFTGVRLPDFDTIEVYIGNEVDYWKYIRDYRGRSVWNLLVAAPVKKASRRLAEELSEELTALFDGGR